MQRLKETKLHSLPDRQEIFTPRTRGFPTWHKLFRSYRQKAANSMEHASRNALPVETCTQNHTHKAFKQQNIFPLVHRLSVSHAIPQS